MNDIRPNALAIIKKDDLLLVQKGYDKGTKESFYRLLGGGIEFGESSNQALKREMKEELNAEITNEKLLSCIENIFEFNSEKYHEIVFLYTADFLEESFYNQENMKIVDKEGAYAEWVPIIEIKNGTVILYPKEAISYL